MLLFYIIIDFQVRKPKITRKHQRPPPDDADDEDAEELYEESNGDMEPPPGMDKVRFKYLTQLIHKQPQSDMKNPHTGTPPASRPNEFQNPAVPIPVGKKKTIGTRIAGPHIANLPRPPTATRRMDNDPEHPAPLPAPAADQFYSDLGKQIASLIRKADTEVDREIDIKVDEVGEVDDVAKAGPIFNINNYPSRSYWDRYVRSPVSHNTEFLDVYGDDREALYDLENKVAMLSKDLPSLNLVQLENIALRNKAPPEILAPQTTAEPSGNSYKLNLLPVFRQKYYDSSYLQPSTEASSHLSTAPKLQQRLNVRDKQTIIQNKFTTSLQKNDNIERHSSRVNTLSNPLVQLVPKHPHINISQKYPHINILPMPKQSNRMLFQPAKSRQPTKETSTMTKSRQFLYIQKLHKPMENRTILRIVPLKITRNIEIPFKEWQNELTGDPLTPAHIVDETPADHNYFQKRIIQRYNPQKRMNSRVFHRRSSDDRDVKRNYLQRKYFEPAHSQPQHTFYNGKFYR